MQCVAVAYLFSVLAGIISFGIGTFLFAMKATTVIQDALEILNIKLKSKRDKHRSVEFMSETVYWHSSLQELGFS